MAAITKEQSSSKSEILDPKHEIATEKLRQSGMGFGGRPLLEQTIGNTLDVI